jgi:hypothetical protein
MEIETGFSVRFQPYFPECWEPGLGEEFFQFFSKRLRLMLPSNVTFLFRVSVFPECCARGRLSYPSAGLPRVSCPFWHSGKTIFPECNSSPSATLGEDWLPRVPDFWHSGKIASPVVLDQNIDPVCRNPAMHNRFSSAHQSKRNTIVTMN